MNIFFINLFGFLIGIVSGLLLPAMPDISFSVASIFIVLVGIICTRRFIVKFKTQYLFVMAFVLGLLYFCLRLEVDILKQESVLKESQSYSLEFRITSIPRQFERSQSFRAIVLGDKNIDVRNGGMTGRDTKHRAMKTNDVTSNNSIHKLSGSLLQLRCFDCVQQFSIGEVWQAEVVLRQNRGLASWGVFDFEKWALSNQIIAQGFIKNSNITLMASDSWLAKQQNRIRETIHASDINVYSKAVFSALSIGDRTAFDRSLWRFLKETGLAHIVAISGLHVGFVFVMANWVCRKILNQFYAIYSYAPAHILSTFAALVLTYYYCVIAGFSLPTQRAFMMLLIFCLLRLTLKELGHSKVLVLAFACIVIVNPTALLSISLWMSTFAVMAILGIMCRNSQVPYLILQLQLSLGMALLSLLFINSASIISPLVNLFVVPIVGLIVLPLMVVSMIAIIVGKPFVAIHLYETLDKAGVYLFEKTFNGYELTKWFFDGAQNHWFTCLGMTLLFLFFVFRSNLLVQKSCLVLTVFCFAVFFIPKNSLKTGEFLVTVLDVGQALAIVVELENYTLIYDVGNQFEVSDSALTTIIPYLRYQGIKHIDTVVISHHDKDHIGGLASLSEAIPIHQIVSHKPLPDELFKKTQFNAFDACYQGQQWLISGVEFTMLSPEKYLAPYFSENNRSCVLKINSQYGKVLLTGDIEREIEHRLVKQHWRFLEGVKKGIFQNFGSLGKAEQGKAKQGIGDYIGDYREGNSQTGFDMQADVLMMAHHGSFTSNTPSFLDAVRPSIAVSSAAFYSPHGHPHSRVLLRAKKRNINHFNTALSGSVQIKFDNAGIHLEEYRKKYRRFWR